MLKTIILQKNSLSVKYLKQSVFYYSILKMKHDNMTPVIKCLNADAENLAGDLLRQMKVIAIPTDTVYGLACSANSPEAINKLYNIKRRDELKPVAICVSNLDEVRLWGKAEHLPDTLLKKLLPGPVTLVFEKTLRLNNPFLNPHTNKIGIRIPDHKFIQRVAAVAGIPIALTSANISSAPSSLCVGEFKSLFSKLDAVFDGSVLSNGLQEGRAGSTVVDLSHPGSYQVLREGVAFEKTIEILQSYDLYSK